MKSSTTTDFWRCYSRLPAHIKQLARRTYQVWAQDPNYSSLHFKKIGRVWSIRVGYITERWGLKRKILLSGSGLVRIMNTIEF